MMDRLLLEDFRCFAGRNEVPIRPITLLVGENSTGKTSFLAAVRAAHDLRSFHGPDFNDEPFHLGSYDQIANYRGGRAGRASSFMIGQQFALHSSTTPDRQFVMADVRPQRDMEAVRIEARFISVSAQPAISEFMTALGDYQLVVRMTGNGQPMISFMSAGEEILSRRVEPWPGSVRDGEALWFIINRVVSGAPAESAGDMSPEAHGHFSRLSSPLMMQWEPGSYSFAPIQTSPQRSYEPVREIRDPEGSHIPMMLARLLGNGSDPDFKERLEEFGVRSGLFSRLTVRKLGRQGSDPFQIEVKHPGGGRARNLADVGYGVSQALPIIADCVSASSGTMLLIQQPEVHLHPRAQAAMGSFFGQLAATGRNRLMIETHSDYLLDRVLMEVREEKLNAEDVIILYFEQGERGSEIHPIEVDPAGRVIDVPDGYRRFFLEEQNRFFGID